MSMIEIYKPFCRGCGEAMTPKNAGKPKVYDNTVAVYAYCEVCKWSEDNE